MDHEDERPGRVRLPGYEQPGPAASTRTDGVRRVRRAGNWTAAALIAGVAAASGYFAHHLPPAGPVAAQASQAPVGGQVAAAGHGVTATRPHPSSGSAAVATSGGSGVAAGPAAGPAGTGSAGAGAASVVWRDN
jgi:hypothetical protein